MEKGRNSRIRRATINPSDDGLAVEDRVLRKKQEETPEDEEAMELLSHPDLLNRFLAFGYEAGHVGEEENRQALYVILTGRKVLNYRMHAGVIGESGAGKSELCRFVLSTMPQQEVLYLGGGVSKKALQFQKDLTGRLIFIDEANKLDDDTWALLREAMTKPEVQRMVTERTESGIYGARTYVAQCDRLVLVQAASRPIVDPANETRFFLLHPDTSPEQTEAILDVQAMRAEGRPPSSLKADLGVWRRAQELLRPCHVEIPYATGLRQLFTSNAIRARRDFDRVLALVAATACLHQYQRPTESEDD